MEIRALQAAYEALRDHLAAQQLYDDAPTGAFDREHLSALFTAYYDAEAATLREVAGNEMDQFKGTIIQDGHIITSLIDTKSLTAQRVKVENDTSVISLTPETGMMMYERNVGADVPSAMFTGRRIASIEELVPRSPRILLTEQLVTPTTLNTSGTLDLIVEGDHIGHVITTMGKSVTVKFPDLKVLMQMKYVELGNPITPGLPGGGIGGIIKPEPTSKLLDDPVNMTAELLVNNVRKAYVSARVDTVVRTTKYDGMNDGRPVYVNYWEADLNYSDAMTGYSFETDPRITDTAIRVQFRYRVWTDSGRGNSLGLWTIAAAVRKPESTLYQSNMLADYVNLGATLYNSTFYGNGLFLSNSISQYVGLAVPRNESSGTAELELRDNDGGFRADKLGPQRWSKKLRKWIPADGVLYRGWSRDGNEVTKRWSYNGLLLGWQKIDTGFLQINFPETFIQTSDYSVRATLILIGWNGMPPSIFVESPTTSGFRLTTFDSGRARHGFMFEVVYTGDYWS